MLEYPRMFKQSQRCHPPHLNVDVLRQTLFSSGLIKKIVSKADSKDPEDAGKRVLDWLLERNKKLGARSEGEWSSSTLLRVKNEAKLKKALVKCNKEGLFLGLDNSWI